VIVVEDVLLHQHFPVAVWFMAASAKGFKLNKPMVAWVLGFVKALAKCPIREVTGQLLLLPNNNISLKKTNKSCDLQAPHGEDDTYPISSKNIRAIPANKRTLIYSLHLRKAFGGMRGLSFFLSFLLVFAHEYYCI
jgi:hypothetical protein